MGKAEKFLSGAGGASVLMAVFIVFFSLTGCVATSGKLQSNRALLDQYKNKALSRGYNYYYCGRSTIPYAVVGIDTAYGFEDRLCFKILSKEAVYQKIGNLSDLHMNSGPLSGSDILDGQGKKVGVWFSRYASTPVRVDQETRMVAVFNPYDPNENSLGER